MMRYARKLVPLRRASPTAASYKKTTLLHFPTFLVPQSSLARAKHLHSARPFPQLNHHLSLFPIPPPNSTRLITYQNVFFPRAKDLSQPQADRGIEEMHNARARAITGTIERPERGVYIARIYHQPESGKGERCK